MIIPEDQQEILDEINGERPPSRRDIVAILLVVLAVLMILALVFIPGPEHPQLP